jgi:hypothetical protein
MTAQVPNMRSFYTDPIGQCNILRQVVSFSASILVHHGTVFVVERYGPSTYILNMVSTRRKLQVLNVLQYHRLTVFSLRRNVTITKL